jgi:hypothetical protein
VDYFTTMTADTSIPTSTLYPADPVSASGISPQTLDIITGVATAFGQVSAGQMQRQNLKSKADQADLESKQAKLVAQQEVNTRRRQLLESLAQQRAAAGSSGLALNSGSVQAGLNQSEAVFRRESNMINQEAELASVTGQARRRILNTESKQALFSGVQRAGTGLLERSYNRQRRGSARGIY